MRQSTKRKRDRKATVEQLYPSEASLCDAFVVWARRCGYVVHPECSGWDLLLVDPGTGLQVGIQAKLKCNADVILQALQPKYDRRGPDVHAVLVADDLHYRGWNEVAKRLRLEVFTGWDLRVWDQMATHAPAVQVPLRKLIENADLWEHSEREWVPEFEIHGMRGGEAGPRQITPWKIAALKLCAVLRSRGYLTSKDFSDARVSIQRWVYSYQPWLKSERHGKQIRYVPTGKPLPDELYPEVRAALVKVPGHHGGDVAPDCPRAGE